jgi:hypothetical protein
LFLLVLRLLAVYFATCALSLFLATRFVSRIRPGIAVLLALGPFLLTGKALLIAGVYAPLDIAYQGQPLASHREEQGIGPTRSPILGDVVFQEIPWRKAVREALKNGRLPLWNRFQNAGEPLLAVQQPAVLHPATWIGFLLPLAQAWTFEMSFRYFLALLAMYLLLRDFGCGQVAALLGAAGWCFSDYLVFFAGYPLSPAAAPFPLLILGLRRFISQPGGRSVGVTVVALLLIVTSGHPETLLHTVAGAGIFFLFELFSAGPGKRWRSLRLAFLAGAITLGLSAAQLLPLFEALPYTAEQVIRSVSYAHSDRSASPEESLRRSIPDVVPYGLGVSGKSRMPMGFGEPAAYAGAILFPLAFIGILSARREKWPLLVIGLLGAALWARLPVVADAVARLPFFDIALNERTVFLTVFSVSGLAALGADRIGRGERLGTTLAATLATAALVGTLFLQVRPMLLRLGMEEEFLRSRAALQIVPLVLLAIALAVGVARSRFARFLPLAALVLLLAERRLEAGRVYPTYPSRAFYPDLEVLKPIPRNEPYRFTSVGFTFVPNTSTLYELEEVRGYESMTFAPLVETFPLWCVPQPVWFNRVDDPARPFLSFLNVRWVLTPEDRPVPPGWRERAVKDGMRLLENPGALERAFVPRRLRYEATVEAESNALQQIQDFAESGVVEASGPERVLAGTWVENGEARVHIESYGAQRLALSIEAGAGGAVVGTSITRWPGWKLRIDGRRSPLATYNRAFLAFRVPPGRHAAVLRYWPDGVAAGLAIAAGTLAACALSAVLLSRGRTRGRSTR